MLGGGISRSPDLPFPEPPQPASQPSPAALSACPRAVVQPRELRGAVLGAADGADPPVLVRMAADALGLVDERVPGTAAAVRSHLWLGLWRL